MKERLRRFLYGTALLTMALVVWETMRANQLEAQVRLGWMDAPRHMPVESQTARSAPQTAPPNGG